MSNFNFADCKKAVNQATFRPTAERKALAAKLLQEALDFVSSLEEVKETKPKAKKRRRKAKRTAAQRTADHMDKQSMRTNEVGPVKPSKKAKKADVEAARKSAEAVSEHTGAAAKAAKKQALREEADKISSLEEKIEMLTQLVALQMQGEPTHMIDAVSIEELPFQL
jgi:hypothetical protein